MEAAAWPGLKALDRLRFAGQLDAPGRDHVFIGAGELAGHLKSGAPLPGRACALTFDDGLRDHFDFVLPELRARGIAGLFYAPAATLE